MTLSLVHSTCFWGGDTFAPQLKIKTKDGKEVPVQQFLQDAYLDMWEVVMKTFADLDCVIGFDVRFPSGSRRRLQSHPRLGVDDE